MHPTLTIPGLGLAASSQQLVFWAAVLGAVTIGPWWIARREGLELSRLRAAQFGLAVVALGGARLHFFLNNPHFYDASPWKNFYPFGGMHMGGALIGLLIGTPLVARYYRLDIPKLCDGTIVVTGVCLAFVRIGCLLGGCCFGSYCEQVWSIRYPRGSVPFVMQQQAGKIAADATASLPVHPAPIYFALAALFSAAVASYVGRRKRYDGQAFWVGLALLAATAALVEPFRALANHRVFWAGVPQLVWIELAIVATALLGLAVSQWRRHRNVANAASNRVRLLRATER
jgi:prolipoprotein diacylglyceryltransferase